MKYGPGNMTGPHHWTQGPLTHCIVLLTLGAVTLFSFAFGLDAPFLLDDTPNLQALIFIRELSIFSDGFRDFVFSGSAGPAGRPLSLFSFALQASAWPDNPAAFKLVNVLLHLLMAVLIYIFCHQLRPVLKLSPQLGFCFPLAVTVLWTLHPIHSATVLYSVQRMAILSNLFMMLGIVLYLHLRMRLNPGGMKQAQTLTLMTLSLLLTGMLALFSKENAPSMIFYLLALEYTLLANTAVNDSFRKWRLIILWGPAAMLLVLCLLYLNQILAGFAQREFSLLQRLSMEATLLWQYLLNTLLPSVANTALVPEVDSERLLSLPLAAISAISWPILLALALKFRRLFPVPAFGLLWFLAGHIVESSILPLELFYQHRNYLAFLGPLLAVIYYLCVWVERSRLAPQFSELIIPGILGLALAIQLTHLSTLWGEPRQLARRWYNDHPGEIRNAEFYAIQLSRNGEQGLLQAAAVYEKLMDEYPQRIRPVLSRMTLSCLSPGIAPLSQSRIEQHLSSQHSRERDLVPLLQQLARLKTGGQCPDLTWTDLQNLMLSLRPGLEAGDQGFIDYELANIAIMEERRERAMELYDRAFSLTDDPGILFTQSIHLINAGRYGVAMEKVDQAIRTLESENNINTGTRESKLQALAGIRTDIEGFIDSQ